MRSGKLENYLPMGENGQAVYISALQLRETLRLQKKNKIADFLAIPQPNETGEKIDWYSPISGEIIPWNTASDEEKEQAYQLLKENQEELKQFSEIKQQSGNKEYQLFGALLGKAIQFPDQEHIYIVGGQPVITFWGFVNAGKQSRLDPVACLKPAIIEPILAKQPVVQPTELVQEPKTPIKKPWWYFLLWLLPLILLLLVAAFFLRGCISSPSLPSSTLTAPDLNIPRSKGKTPSFTGHDLQQSNVATIPTTATTIPSTGAFAGGVTEPNTAINNPLDTNNGLVPPNGVIPQVDPALPASLPNEPLQTTQMPAVPNGLPPVAPEMLQPNANTAMPPIEIPQESIQNGSIGFLNGQWKAGAGIQDQKTGKPLRLQYRINDGKGEVIMTRSDGLTCVAPVSAAMKTGALSIENQASANCDDGSSYKMPNITCQPGANNITECQGEYNKNQRFPISMKRESN